MPSNQICKHPIKRAKHPAFTQAKHSIAWQPTHALHQRQVQPSAFLLQTLTHIFQTSLFRFSHSADMTAMPDAATRPTQTKLVRSQDHSTSYSFLDAAARPTQTKLVRSHSHRHQVIPRRATRNSMPVFGLQFSSHDQHLLQAFPCRELQCQNTTTAKRK